jgi:hypothetical protein
MIRATIAGISFWMKVISSTVAAPIFFIAEIAMGFE